MNTVVRNTVNPRLKSRHAQFSESDERRRSRIFSASARRCKNSYTENKFGCMKEATKTKLDTKPNGGVGGGSKEQHLGE